MLASLSFRKHSFDLQATLNGWDTSSTEHLVPKFEGKQKDPTPEFWLDAVERGCKARNVPKTHWPDVAKHFMDKKPRGRVAEVEKVMHIMRGGKWVWTWKDFRKAVLNMGWNKGDKETREVKVERKESGFWKIVTGQRDNPVPLDAESNQSFSAKLSKFLGSAPDKPAVISKGRAAKKDEKDTGARPTLKHSISSFSLPTLSFFQPTPPPPVEEATTNKYSAHVPMWLLDATETLATFVKENPEVVQGIVTVLISVGTLGGQ